MAKVTACKAKQLKCDDTNFTKVLQKAKNWTRIRGDMILEGKQVTILVNMPFLLTFD
jgi:hypothetical protein